MGYHGQSACTIYFNSETDTTCMAKHSQWNGHRAPLKFRGISFAIIAALKSLLFFFPPTNDLYSCDMIFVTISSILSNLSHLIYAITNVRRKSNCCYWDCCCCCCCLLPTVCHTRFSLCFIVYFVVLNVFHFIYNTEHRRNGKYLYYLFTPQLDIHGISRNVNTESIHVCIRFVVKASISRRSHRAVAHI